MKLIDVVNAPWAIQPEKLIEIQAIYATHMRGEKIDIDAVEKRLGRPLVNEPQTYEIRDGVAIIPVNGVLAKRANLMTQVSGMSSSEQIGRDIKQAAADPAVLAIILAVDSPGGTVDGTQALASIVAEAARSKPVATLADNSMCSAAYWIGVQANEVWIAGDTVMVGSIGVVAGHTDISGAQAAAGIKTTEITAGKYKRVASQYGPLTEDGRATIQAQVDYIYSVFVAEVSRARGVPEEKVISDMADGRVFLGKQAVDAGLVDGVSTLDSLIVRLKQRAAGVAVNDNHAPRAEGETMDRESILAQAPELADAFRVEGAQAERQRIADVEAQALPGHDALIAALKADGKTTGPEAAAQVLAAERAKLSSIAVQLASDAPSPVPHADAADPAAESQDPRTALHNKAKQYQADHPGTTYLAAVRAVSAD